MRNFFFARKDTILQRFFLLPLIILLMLLTSAPSNMALAASIQQSTGMQQLHLRSHQAPAQPFLPAVTCSRNGCTGLDPNATGCSADATTLLSKNIVNSSGQSIGKIELRWSPTCQTNWARVTSFIGSAPLGASVEREAGVDGPFAEECVPTCDTFVTATSAFTDMVWAPDVAASATGAVIQNNTFFKSCVTQDPSGLPC